MIGEEWSIHFSLSVSSSKKNNRKVLLWLILSGLLKQYSSSFINGLPYNKASALLHQSPTSHQNSGKFILTSGSLTMVPHFTREQLPLLLFLGVSGTLNPKSLVTRELRCLCQIKRLQRHSESQSLEQRVSNVHSQTARWMQSLHWASKNPPYFWRISFTLYDVT